MKLTPEMLTGKSREHLINLPTPHSPNHFLQAEAMKAFQGLQQSAVKNGIDFIALEEQVTKNNTAPLERAIKLCSLLNIE